MYVDARSANAASAADGGASHRSRSRAEGGGGGAAETAIEAIRSGLWADGQRACTVLPSTATDPSHDDI
jgi:hypothetical protein